MTEREQNSHRGIVLCVIAFMFFSSSDALRKYLSLTISVHDILFWVGCFGCLSLIMLAPFLGGFRSVVESNNKRLHMMRGAVMALNSLFALLTLSNVPIIDAYTIWFTTPFVISLISVFLYKEPLGRMRIMAILVGFMGGVIAFRPGFVALDPAYLYAVMAVFTFTTFNLIAKNIKEEQGLISYALYPMLGMVVLNFILLGGQVKFDFAPWAWLLLGLAGAVHAQAMIWVSRAFQMGEASVIAPYQYTQLFWGIVFGYLVFGDVPDGFKILGGGITVASGVFFFMRERRAMAIQG